jgi:hypothetical protein
MNSSIVIMEEGDSSTKLGPRDKPEKNEDIKPARSESKGKLRSTTSGLSYPTSDTMIVLSSVKELLANSRLMLERLELAEDELATNQPETLELCHSHQQRTSAIKQEKKTSEAGMVTTVTDSSVATAKKAAFPATNISNEKVASFPINVAQLMPETAINSECVPLIKKRMENNLVVIYTAAKERDALVTLIREKTTENTMLSTFLLNLSEKQVSTSKQLEIELESNNKELENAMGQMCTPVMGDENQRV